MASTSTNCYNTLPLPQRRASLSPQRCRSMAPAALQERDLLMKTYWRAMIAGSLLAFSTTRAAAQSYGFSTLAGFNSSGSADGTGGAARFNRPGGAAVDGNGNVYV